MSRNTVSSALFLLALVLLFGIGGAADTRPLNGTDALIALAGAACIYLGVLIERGRA